MLDKDYKIPDRGKPSIFVGERQSSALVLLKKSLRSRVINESLRKLRGLVIGFNWQKANDVFSGLNIVNLRIGAKKSRLHTFRAQNSQRTGILLI